MLAILWGFKDGTRDLERCANVNEYSRREEADQDHYALIHSYAEKLRKSCGISQIKSVKLDWIAAEEQESAKLRS